MIVIGADFVPTKSNQTLFQNGNTLQLFGEELEQLLLQADFRIFNLEMPLCNRKNPISKTGKNLSAPSNCITAYRTIRTDLLTLANNHILDQDAAGIAETTDTLRKNGIAYVGVGQNVKEAAKPFCFDYHGKRIGVYACTEHEFSVVSDGTLGANPFDPLESTDHVKALKAQSNYVIVLYHGGKEYYRYPSPMLQKTCRKLVEKGADLVICQHSHCIGCEEKYLGGTIVYGQGNFLFDNSERESWQTGLLVCIDDELNIDYIPLTKTGNTVRVAGGESGREILNGFYQRSHKITQTGFVADNYKQYAKEQIDLYLSAISGRRSFMFRVLNRLTSRKLFYFHAKIRYGKREKLLLQNYMECESLRELIIEGLQEK